MGYENPRDRLELFLKKIIDKSTAPAERRTRFEQFLAGILDGSLVPDDPRTRLELYLKGVAESGGYIPPSGTLNITANGIYNVEQYKYAQVAVPAPTPQTEALSITIGAVGNQIVTYYPGYGKTYSDVTLYRDDNVIAPGNIKKDVVIFGVTGTYEAGGSSQATFGRTLTLTYQFTGSTDNDRKQALYYRGYDPLNIDHVIWKSVDLSADGSSHTVTVDLCPSLSDDPDNDLNAVVDGFYIKGTDGSVTGDMTVISGDAACRYIETDASGNTGSEYYYIVVRGTAASIQIYLAN